MPIHDIGPRERRIRNIGPTEKRIDPETVRKALGAEDLGVVIHQFKGVVVLAFSSNAVAKAHGANLLAMDDAARFYAIGGDDATDTEMAKALEAAREADNKHSKDVE